MSPKDSGRRRVFISGANSLVGHSLFESMRNDHLAIHSGEKPHKFTGTIIRRDETTTPIPSDSIEILDIKKKPRTFAKNVMKSDTIIVDLLSGTDLEEAEQIIKILRQPRTE
jgi:hypothetical protein